MNQELIQEAKALIRKNRELQNLKNELEQQPIFYYAVIVDGFLWSLESDQKLATQYKNDALRDGKSATIVLIDSLKQLQNELKIFFVMHNSWVSKGIRE